MRMRHSQPVSHIRRDLEGVDRSWGPLMATSLLSIVPVLIIFLPAQCFIVDALAPGIGEK